MTKAIDVSYNQNNISDLQWQDIKNKCDFVILRVGYRGYESGKNVLDKKFKEYFNKVKQYKIPYALYFFSQAINEYEGAEEANFLINNSDYKNSLFCAIDSEWSNQNHTGRADSISKKERTSAMIGFYNKIRQNNVIPVLYASSSWFTSNLNMSLLNGFKTWVADYRGYCGYKNNMIIWQTDSANSLKITGFNRLDCNNCYYDFFTEEKEDNKKVEDIVKYSLSKDGNKNISQHFKVREFRCKDGSDEILISSKLAKLLENIRIHFGKPVVINSAYRTPSYNKKVGGSDSSYHILGTAADISISGIDPLAVALYIESLNPNSYGIGLYKKTSEFVHIDIRSDKKRWITTVGTSKYTYVDSIMPTVRQGNNGEAVKILQFELGLKLIDGKFGSGTLNSVKDFQKKNILSSDGIVGKNTWNKLSK